MSNINKFLANILAARYGKDVRQSIHDAIKEIDSVADTAQDSATKMANQASNHETVARQCMESALASAESARISAEQAMSGTPEGYAALIEQVESIDIKTSNEYDLFGTKQGGYRLTELVGTTKQKQNSGKNFLDAPKTLSLVSLGQDYSVDVNMPAGKYIISADEIVSTAPTEMFLTLETPTEKQTLAFSLNYENKTFTIKNTVTRIRIAIPVTVDFNGTELKGTVTFTNLMIRKADIADATYEEFTNGEAIPNTSNQQPIEHVGDCVEMVQGSRSKTNTITVENGWITSKNFIPCKSGDDISLDYVKSINTLRISFYDSNKSFISWVFVDDGNAVNGVAPTNANYFICELADLNGIAPQTVGKISLTVNGKHVVQIVEKWKNLSKLVKTTINTTFDETTCTLTTNYSQKLTGAKVQFYNGTSFVIEPYKKIPIGKNVLEITKLANFNQIVLGFYDTSDDIRVFLDVSALKDNEKYYVQLNVDDANNCISGIMVTTNPEYDDTYEPYTEKVATIFLDEPLREGDRLVKIGGYWYVERVKACTVFDKNANLTVGSMNSKRVVVYAKWNGVVDLDIQKKESSLCNMLVLDSKAWNSTYLVDSYSIDSNGNWYFNFPRTLYGESMGTLLEWLGNNPLEIIYPLATPTLTPLDTESQLALNGLVTFDGVTYLEVDSKIKSSGIKGEYGTSQVGAYTLKCMNDNDTDRVERAKLMEMILSLGGNA